MVIQVRHPQLGIREFPDDTPESEMKAAIRKELSFGEQQPGVLGSFGIGAGHGALRAGQGLKQLGLLAGEKLGVVPRGTLSNYSKGVDAEEALYQATPVGGGLAGTIGDIAGQAAAFVAGGIATGGASLVPSGIRAAYPLASRILGGVGAGAATGAASYVPEGASRAEGAALGGVFGPIGEYGASKLGQGVNKLLNARSGNFTDPNVGKLLQQSEEVGIPLHAQNVLANATVQKGSQFLENLPVGMAKRVNAQADTAINVIEQKKADALKRLVDTNYNGSDGFQKIEKAALDPFDPHTGAAKQLLEELPDFGDISDKQIRNVVGTSFKAKLLKNKIDAASKFNIVQQLSGDTPVPVSKLRGILPEIEKDIYNPNVIPSKGLQDQFQEIKRVAEQPELNFNEVRKLRTTVADYIKQYHTGDNVGVGSSGEGYLQRIKNTIGEDIDDYAKSNPVLKDAYEDAQNYYKKNVASYKNNIMARALRSADPDSIYKAFVKTGQADGVPKLFYEALDERGRQAVRAGIYRDALQTSLTKGEVSPQKFANAIESRKGVIDTFFKGKDYEEIKGLQNVLQTLGPRVGRSPATGVQARELAQGGGVVAGLLLSPFKTLTGLLTGNAATRILTSPAGVRFLAASSKLPPGSPKLEMLLKQFEKTAGTIAAQRGQKAGTK